MDHAQPILTLDDSTVDLWWLDASVPGASHAELEAQLSAPERDRLAMLRHPDVQRHRRYFRARQRQILSLYTGIDPAKQVFGESAHGKPFLKHAAAPTFNLTHSGEFGLLAVTGAPGVGVDMEVTTRRTEFGELANRFFAPTETDALSALPVERQRAAFFTGWVRKEAWIKALGTGLATALDAFVVSLDSELTTNWMIDAGSTGQANEWSFVVPHPLPESNCLAAIAVQHSHIQLRWRRMADFKCF